MRDNSRIPDSVHTVVTSNVTNDIDGSLNRPKINVIGGNDTIRHVTGSPYGWVYQRRMPRNLPFSSSQIIFRKRLGARGKAQIIRTNEIDRVISTPNVNFDPTKSLDEKVDELFGNTVMAELIFDRFPAG